MADDIANLVIKIDSDGVVRGSKRLDHLADKSSEAERKTKKLTDRFKGSITHIRNMGFALAGVVTALGAMAFRALSGADEIGKLSDRLGISTEALSQYRHVAEQSNIEFRTLTIGLQRMARRISEAAIGTGEAKDAIKELGFNAVELNKLAPEEQFEAMADALHGLENANDRTRLAMKLFDSEGVALIQTMTNGAQGIRDMRKEADDMNLTLSKDQTDAAAKAKNSIGLLKTSVVGLSETLAIEFADSLSSVIRQLAIGIPGAAQSARNAFKGIGGDILSIWEFLNPSDITGGTTLEDALERQSELIKRRDEIINGPQGTAMLDRTEKELQKANELVDFLRRRNKLEEEFRNKKPIVIPGPGDLDDGGGDVGIDEDPGVEKLRRSLMTEKELLAEQFLDKQEMLDEWLEAKTITEADHFELEASLHLQHNERLTAIERQEQQKRLKQEQDVQNMIAGMRQNNANLAVGLLRTMSKENEDFARATILVEKGLAIARVIQNYEVAKAAAMAILNPGLAAAMEVQKNISIGLIAATGLAQLSQTGGGGGVASQQITSSADDPFSAQNSTSVQPQGRQITINIEGNILGTEDGIRDVVVRAIEQAETNDEIRLISNG